LSVNADRSQDNSGMSEDKTLNDRRFELRPVIGLTKGLTQSDLEILTVDAILEHRRLSLEADMLYDALPEEFRLGQAFGGVEHRAYVKAMIAMHAQMAALSSLLDVLGYTPTVPEN
jgi:hypothetical protein